MPAYTPLTQTEIDANINMASATGRSGIYPSGAAHFFDTQQNFWVDIPSQPADSIFDFNLLNSPFSNSVESYIIDDFTIFNPYIHNTGNFTVNVASLLNVAAQRYNIYSTNFRARP